MHFIFAVYFLFESYIVHSPQVEILSSLSHPHVIEFYGTVVGQPKGFGDCMITGWSSVRGNDCLVHHYFINEFWSEFAENGSIFDYLHERHHQPTLKQSLLWGKQVAEGIVCKWKMSGEQYSYIYE